MDLKPLLVSEGAVAVNDYSAETHAGYLVSVDPHIVHRRVAVLHLHTRVAA